MIGLTICKALLNRHNKTNMILYGHDMRNMIISMHLLWVTFPGHPFLTWQCDMHYVIVKDMDYQQCIYLIYNRIV